MTDLLAIRGMRKSFGANLVLDPLGGEFTGQAFSAVSKFGRLVHLGGGAGAKVAEVQQRDARPIADLSPRQVCQPGVGARCLPGSALPAPIA